MQAGWHNGGEGPASARLQKEYTAKDVDVVAVNVFAADGLEKWRKYLNRFGGGDLIIAQDPRQKVVRAFRVRTSGTTIVIDRKGKEIFRGEYFSSFDTLKNAVEVGL